MSLRRADNVRLTFKRGFLGSKGTLTFHVGARKTYDLGKLTVDEFERAVEYQRDYPWKVVRIGERAYWHFANQYYWENEELDADSVYALLVTRRQRQQQQVARAHQIVAMGNTPRPHRRGQIPEDLKQLVWVRDQGRCRSCNSPSELQFDHVIPISMGGATSPENLQLLCGPCNRRKGANIRFR